VLLWGSWACRRAVHGFSPQTNQQEETTQGGRSRRVASRQRYCPFARPTTHPDQPVAPPGPQRWHWSAVWTGGAGWGRLGPSKGPGGDGLGTSGGAMRACGLVLAVLGHDGWDAPCEARLGTEVAAAVGGGVARLRMAATNTAHPPTVGVRLGMRPGPHPCEHGLLGRRPRRRGPGCGTCADPGASI
jgi:hypothetical protein